METGEPYLMFEDAVQADLPDFQKRKGLRVNHSNLCSEITLATNEERTAVCCLSSVNLEYYNEWSRVPAFIPDLVFCVYAFALNGSILGEVLPHRILELALGAIANK